MSLTATVSSPIASLSIVRPNEQCLKQHQNVWSSPVGLKSFSFKQQKNVWSSLVGLKSLSLKQHKNVWSSPVGLKPLCKQLKPFESKGSITRGSRLKHASFICAAALNATCAAEQTQTVTRQSSTITVAPIQGKEKSPDLDDGGDGFPPRDDGDGGGGGGGGGGHWSGGFFFFGFLAFLGLLKDKESEGPYDDRRRR